MIYVLRCKATGLVKIGYTGAETAAQRLRDLQTSSPGELELLGTLPGDKKTEGALHRRFELDHVRGEWFALCAVSIEELLGVRGKLPTSLARAPRTQRDFLIEMQAQHDEAIARFRDRVVARNLNADSVRYDEISDLLDRIVERLAWVGARDPERRVWAAAAEAARAELEDIQEETVGPLDASALADEEQARS